MKTIPRVLAILIVSATWAFAETPQPADRQVPPADSTTRSSNPASVPAPTGAMAFGRVDKDRSGDISQAEFDALNMTGTTLVQVDANRDGKLSNDEWSMHHGKRNNRDDR
jgi:hypothetical protein